MRRTDYSAVEIVGSAVHLPRNSLERANKRVTVKFVWDGKDTESVMAHGNNVEALKGRFITGAEGLCSTDAWCDFCNHIRRRVAIHDTRAAMGIKPEMFDDSPSSGVATRLGYRRASVTARG